MKKSHRDSISEGSEPIGTRITPSENNLLTYDSWHHSQSPPPEININERSFRFTPLPEFREGRYPGNQARHAYRQIEEMKNEMGFQVTERVGEGY